MSKSCDSADAAGGRRVGLGRHDRDDGKCDHYLGESIGVHLVGVDPAEGHAGAGSEGLAQHCGDDAETLVARRAGVRLHRVGKVVTVGAHDDRP